MPKCDLCDIEIQEVDLGQGLELAGGKELKFLKDDKEYYVIRCDKCFENDKTLKKFQKCEVFSRVCGYIRPVQQWHKGKVEEYEDRINFKNTMEDTPEVPVEAPVEAPVEKVAE